LARLLARGAVSNYSNSWENLGDAFLDTTGLESAIVKKDSTTSPIGSKDVFATNVTTVASFTLIRFSVLVSASRTAITFAANFALEIDPMNASEILDFVRSNPFCALATVEAGEPRVRTVMILRADEHGILFNTGFSKDLCKQIEANAAVELCFFDPKTQVQVRVRGRFALQKDAGTHALVLEKLPFLKPMVEAHGTDLLAPYLLNQGLATVWTMATNMAPKSFVQL
jgi:pyridoxamine 5'-phosphate oxidase